MKREQRAHFINMMIGVYLALYIGWVVFNLARYIVGEFNMLSADYVPWEYLKSTWYLSVGTFLSEVCLCLSGIMCVKAWLRCKDGQYIMRAGSICLVAYVVPIITYAIYARLQINGYLLIPAILILSGYRWKKYLTNKTIVDRPSEGQRWPFLHELRVYRTLRSRDHDVE